MNTRTILLTTALALSACTSTGGANTDTDTEGHATTDMSPTTGETGELPVVVELGAPCNFGPEGADELALVTNDFSAHGLGRLDIDDRLITPDLAPASTDTALGARGDWIVMVHRYGHNRIEVVDRPGWTVRGAVDVSHSGVAEPNPQGVTFADDGLGYVPLFAAPAVQIYDFAGAPAQWLAGSIDLSDFADDDGTPEAGVALACGRVLFVAIQRLVDFTPVDGHSHLVALDLDARAALDLDPDADGSQAIALLGAYPRQFRRDPADLSGHTALVLTSGVERVDLSHGTSTWAVAPELLAAVGVDGFDPQAFALAPDGLSVFITATDGDFPGAAVFHVGLDGGEPATPVKFVSGLVSGDRMLEQLDGSLWVGDANPTDPRLRVFDAISGDEELSDGLQTNIAPWTFIPLP